MMPLYHVITVDGPVGVGKSAVARQIANELGYRHIDTGAMYRSVTLAAMRQGVSLEDPQALTRLAGECEIQLVYRDHDLQVLLNGDDVTQAIRQPEVSKNTSPVADTPGVRKRLVSLQRQLGLRGPSVLEGRDISTVVFPDAFWKFYLEASLQERTRRRVLQLQKSGNIQDFEATRRALIRRDERDRSRAYGPLRIASDAIIIDTTFLEEREVIKLILSFIQAIGAPALP